MRGERPWAQLLRLVEHLPRESHYKAALADDEDLARRYLDQVGDEASTSEPTFEGFDRHLEALYVVVDLLNALCVMTAGNDDKPEPMPRPQPAIDRVRHDVAYERHIDLVRQLLPSTGEQQGRG